MAIQTVFQAGNSKVVAIPTEVARGLDVEIGGKVEWKATSSGYTLIRQEDDNKRTAPKSVIDKEFKKWLENALEEDKEILDELAKR